MKESLVVSLELAKEMKGLGFPQESEFYWEVYDGPINLPQLVTIKYPKTEQHYMDTYSAYLTGELGEWLLLSYCKTYRSVGHGKKIKNIKWRCEWSRKPKYSKDMWGKTVSFECNTEANARAKMLIHLAKEKIINPEEL